MKEITIMLLVMALLTSIIFEFIDCHPVPDEKQLYVTTQLHNFNTMKSIPGAANIDISNTENATNKMINRKYTIPKTNLPSSPVGLLRPDTFQFYTFNQNGDVVMKQMSEKEIQTLIASTGGHFPMEIHEPQVVAEISSGETKVADVVQNVQNVLKAELNKPPSVMTSMPTIPGHDNSDWSNILPSILAGDMEPDVTSKPDHIQDVDLPEGIAQNPIPDPGSGLSNPIKHEAKPMIPVAVITVEQQTPSYNNKEEVDGIPIFHILNTITADKKDSFTRTPNQTLATILPLDEMSDASEPVTPCSIMTTCKNSTINKVESGYPSVVEISINETIKNHEMEKPRPLIITNNIETKSDSENSLHFNVLSINENNVTVNLEKVTNNSKEPQFQGENEKFAVTESNTEKLIFSKTSNKTEETTAISEISSILHKMELSHNEMSIIKLNSSIDQQTLVDDTNGQFKGSQMVYSVTNDGNHVHNVTIIPQSEIFEIACCDKISSTPPEYVSQKSPSSAVPSEHFNTFTTVLTNIPKIHETNSSTTIYVQRTTVTPTSHEIFTFNTQVQSTKEKFNNSNSYTVNNVVVPEEKNTLPTAATPIILEDTLPNGISIPTEPIPNELANSLSSMISQISQMLPSIIPPSNDLHESVNATEKVEISDEINPQPTNNSETKSEHFSTEKNTMNMSANHDHIEISENSNTFDNSTEIGTKFQDNLKLNLESGQEHVDEKKKEIIGKIHETPIVRIDIMETIPTIIDKKMNVTPVNRDNDDYNDDERTESPMVRIKLTDPISTLNHILESSPVQNSTLEEIEIVTLPTNKNISANGIGSGLIAGFIPNTNESTSLKYLSSINDTGANGLVFNETSENVDGIMEKSIVRINSTTPLPNIKIQTEFENITHTPLSNISEGNMLVITDLSSFTEVTKTMNLSTCLYQNFSQQNDVGDKSLCSAPSNVVRDSNETVADANEKHVIQPLRSTTIPPYVSTKLWNEHEMVKQEAATDNIIIPALLEVKVTDTTDIIMTQMPNQIHLDNKLQSQSLSQHDPEFSGFKSENSSSNTEHSMDLGSQMDHTVEQTFLSLQQELPSSPRLPDTIENNSDMMIPNQMKDIKKEDLGIGSMEKVAAGKIPAVSLKLDNFSKPIQKFPILSKLNFTEETTTSEKWTLISQDNHFNSQNISAAITNPLEQRIAVIQKESEKSPQTDAFSGPKGALGLDSSIGKLDADISYFSILCNDLAFKYWNSVNSGLSTSRSIALSPFGMTSILAMLFLGARSPTSDRMNEVLKLDDVTSFNPHLVFQNVTDSVSIAQNQGMANVAFVRELFADQSKVRKLMRFYKKQAEQFYDGMVEQVNFSTISDAVRRKTNFLIRKQTGGRIRNFVKSNTVPLRSPLAALSANVFQTDCNSNDATSRGRDGELYFAVSPAVRQRKLVLVPATLWKAGVLAGYEPSLDATAYAIGGIDKIVSTIFVIPGQQGSTASDDNLDLLEQRIISGVLHDAAWNKLLKVIVPRPGLELQIPKFSHKSVINATAALKLMGLEELFLQCADFKGINGVGNDFHLADVIQMNLFSTCGDENIQSGKTKHHVEIYPASPQRNARESKHNEDKTDTDDHGISKYISNSLKSLEAMTPSSTVTITTTKIKNEDKPRVKLDKPFLYFVRHNPTGLILFMGRFNPRLLP